MQYEGFIKDQLIMVATVKGPEGGPAEVKKQYQVTQKVKDYVKANFKRGDKIVTKKSDFKKIDNVVVIQKLVKFAPNAQAGSQRNSRSNSGWKSDKDPIAISRQVIFKGAIELVAKLGGEPQDVINNYKALKVLEKELANKEDYTSTPQTTSTPSATTTPQMEEDDVPPMEMEEDGVQEQVME